MNKKILAILVLGVFIIAAITAVIFLSRGKKDTYIMGLKVTTSFYPLAYLVDQIGGEYVNTTILTPAGTEPHDFEPNAQDMARLESQDIIFLNGGGVEGYGEELRTKALFVGESVMNNTRDPHVWLDPVLYLKEAEIVAKELIKKDPQHEREFTVQSEKLKTELNILNNEFRQGLANCKHKNIITSHNAFGYLAKRYGFNQLSLSGLSPEQEPSSQTLAHIATFAKKNNIKYVFFEELVSPAIAETIAREVGAKTLVLNPIEGLTKKDENEGKTYMSIQRENLKNLRLALECE
jgi:zinc transport system substrate-binding protein